MASPRGREVSYVAAEQTDSQVFIVGWVIDDLKKIEHGRVILAFLLHYTFA